MSSDLSVVSMQSQVSQSQAQPVDIQGFEVLLANPVDFVQGLTGLLRLLSVRLRSVARRFMFGTKLCITAM